MDKTEVTNTNLKLNNKVIYPMAAGSAVKEYNHELHGTTEKCILDSSTKSNFQNSDANKKRSSSLNFPDNTDSCVSTNRSTINSRSMSQNDSVSDNLKKKLPINKWSYLDNSESSFSSLLAHAISTKKIGSLPKLQDDSNFQSISPSRENENMLPVCVKNGNTSDAQIPIESSSCETLEDDIGNEIKCQIALPSEKKEVFHIKQSSEMTNGIHNHSSRNSSDFKIPEIKFGEYEESQKPKEIGTPPITDEYLLPDSISLKSRESSLSSPESEEFKVEIGEKNEENSDDASFFDGLHDGLMNYIERPLLPLKPLQKRSRSCTNIVQTIKGFTKRKTSGTNRLSSPDNALTQRKELSTSEANISNAPRKQSTEVVAQDFRRGNNNDESFTNKNIRQSLQSYTWYHLVDAKEASKRLLNMHQNGAFLIRPASNPTSEVLHTLCVVYARRVYNYHVRNLKDGRITLGNTKAPEKTFLTLLEMIKYHQTVPIPINFAGELGYVHLLITPSK